MKAQEIARMCVRALALEPEKRLLVNVRDDGVRSQVASLAESAGAILTDDNPDAVLVSAKDLSSPLLPGHLVEARRRLPGGVPLVVLVSKGPAKEEQDTYEAGVKRRLKLERCRIEPIGEHWLVVGSTAKGLSSSDRKKLRSEGHGLDPVILIGRSGLTRSIVEATLSAVERHGLIKVKLTPQSTEDKDEAAQALAWATGSHLVQRVGKTALLYREDVTLDPPSKRVRRH